MVEEVVERIAYEIASGAYAPGERLPSVRAMASRYNVNPSTVQVIIARLRTIGFIESSPGVGSIVKDIEQQGGIETWRYLFRFAQRLPERAVKLFEGFLATRRVLVLAVVKSALEAPQSYDLSPLKRAVERLQLAVEGGAEPEQLAQVELSAARVLMRQLDQPVPLALYNSVSEILQTVPAVLSAMYTNPRFNLSLWAGLIAGWEAGAQGAQAGLDQAEAALVEHHKACVARFRELLASTKR